jgi:hypothetical protein
MWIYCCGYKLFASKNNTFRVHSNTEKFVCHRRTSRKEAKTEPMDCGDNSALVFHSLPLVSSTSTDYDVSARSSETLTNTHYFYCVPTNALIIIHVKTLKCDTFKIFKTLKII